MSRQATRQSPPLYLASESARRHALLLQIGVAHTVLRVPRPEGIDEPQEPGESAVHYVRRTAREKVERALQWLDSSQRPAGLVPAGAARILGADTVVSLQGDVLGKPRDRDDAARMLGRLSGKKHEVRTAVVIACGGRILEAESVTQVWFRSLAAHEITRYCNSDEPLGKAGAYAIQGRAGAFVRHLSGSYTGVVGLPVYEVFALLAQLDRDPAGEPAPAEG